jgi:hypothetical protein
MPTAWAVGIIFPRRLKDRSQGGALSLNWGGYTGGFCLPGEETRAGEQREEQLFARDG